MSNVIHLESYDARRPQYSQLDVDKILDRERAQALDLEKRTWRWVAGVTFALTSLGWIAAWCTFG